MRTAFFSVFTANSPATASIPFVLLIKTNRVFVRYAVNDARFTRMPGEEMYVFSPGCNVSICGDWFTCVPYPIPPAGIPAPGGIIGEIWGVTCAGSFADN